MPYIYRNPNSLVTHPVVGSGTCVDLIKLLVPGLIGVPTSAWCAGKNVMEERGRIMPGTAIATFDKNGKYPHHATGNHAALVLQVMPSGIWVMDQWVSKTRTEISKRLIVVPPRWKQRTADGNLADMSNNALAFFVIERCAR